MPNDPNTPIVLTHSKLDGAEFTAVTEDQATVLEQSGWKRKSKAAQAKTAEEK